MLDFLRGLFGTDFMPHFYCLRGERGVLWLHVVSDLLIAAAYFAIPLVLFDVILKRRDLLFRRVALLFVIFIAACGTTHLLAIWTIWVPVYRFEGAVKAVTAVASVTTALVLVRIRPLIFRLPTIAQLAEEIERRKEAEHRAVWQEQRFRALVDSVTDYAIYMLDPEGVILSWNNGAQRLKGYEADQIVGKPYSIFFLPEDQAAGVPQDVLRTARETGGYEGEGWRVRKNATRFLVNAHIRPLIEEGDLKGFSVVTRDLTETREMEEKYRMLLEAAPDAIVIVNQEGQVDYINAQAEKLFGYRRAEVQGRPVDLLVPSRGQAAQAAYLLKLLDGVVHPSVDAPEEIFGMRKNGTEFPLEFSVSPLDTKSGGVLLFAIRDLTEKRLTEQRFRAVLEAAPDPLFITNREDRIIYMNRRAEEIFGFYRGEILGQTADVLIPERLRTERALERKEFFVHPDRIVSGYGGEYLCLRADGSEFAVEASRSPLDTADGPVILTSVRDVTERKKTETQFRIMLDAAPDAIVIVNREGGVEFANLQMEKLFGYERGEMVGITIQDMEPERLREVQDRKLAAYFESLRRIEIDAGDGMIARRKDGSEFPVECTLSPLETARGWIYLIAVRDVTEGLRAETQFRTLLEAAPDAIVITNPEGIVQYVNRQAEKLYGYTRVEILGQPSAMLAPAHIREERVAYRNLLFAGQAGLEDSGLPPETTGLRKDGSQFPLEFSFSPLDTLDGKLFLFAVRDISERRKSEARFRALLDSAPDAMVISGADGAIQLTNLQAERLFGYTREEMVGQPVRMLIPSSLQDSYAQDETAFMQGDFGRDMGAGPELRALRKDGTEVPVEIRFSPLEGPNGFSVTAAIRDISERVKSEMRFRALLEAAPDAVILYGQPDKIVYVNRRAEELLGWERAELLGKPSDLLIPERVREERRERKRMIDEMAALGTTLNEERPYLRKDGSEFDADITASPIETPEGPVLLAFVRDTTERKRTEARFRALLESAPDAMVIVNSEGSIEMANIQSERMFGYKRSELVGKSVDILVPSLLRAGHRHNRAEFFAHPKERAMGIGRELHALRKDGTEFPVEISLSPLEGPSGTSVTAAIRDITERERAAKLLAVKMAELHQSNEALEQFAHIASHDLQEPLRMVASYTQLLARRYKGRLDSDADDFIAFAVDGTQRMKRLIEDLLQYSRAGRGAPPGRELWSEDSLKEALRNLSAAIEESHAEITFDNLPKVKAVDSQLIQLFQNLVGNAIKYRGDRTPRIHISAAANETEWVFSVADHGIGIEAKYYDRVFVIFQRLHGRAEYEGTGIGLAICKRILQQQGGRIWVESEPGVGSTFYFALPMR